MGGGGGFMGVMVLWGEPQRGRGYYGEREKEEKING